MGRKINDDKQEDLLFKVDKIEIKRDDPLFNLFAEWTTNATNLYNRALFIERQVWSAMKKDLQDLTENERAVFDLIDRNYQKMDQIKERIYQKSLREEKPKERQYYRLPTPEKAFLDYNFLDALLKVSNDQNYRSLPNVISQSVLKNLKYDYSNYFRSLREYKLCSSKYTGKPKPPGYRQKGSKSTIAIPGKFVNFKQDSLTFPGGGANAKANLEKKDRKISIRSRPELDFFGVEIRPFYETYQIQIKYKCKNQKDVSPVIEKVAAIDLGSKNLAAIVISTGGPCALVKSAAMRSRIEFTNKYLSLYSSRLTKHTTKKIPPTKRRNALIRKTNLIIEDYIHCSAKKNIKYCLERGVDTIVVGSNSGWKQRVHFKKKKDTRQFVSIPHDTLKENIKYLCKENGLRYYEQEESYTSKSSFIHQDPIPVYQKGVKNTIQFSGRRLSEGKVLKSGKRENQRGVYKTKEGRKINSDLNGAANIGRKMFPSLFKTIPDFDTIYVL